MTENKRIETNALHHIPNQTNDNAVILRVPKPNLQIVVLGLIAVITVFQTFQLVRISSRASSVSVKTVSPANTGTGSNIDVPQSMVGGC